LGPPVIGIANIDHNYYVTVNPSPSTGKITVLYSFPEEYSFEIAIRNMAGQVVYQDHCLINKTGRQKIDLSELPKGVYLLAATFGVNPYTREVIENTCKFIIE
jgi:hypothetical protein